MGRWSRGDRGRKKLIMRPSKLFHCLSLRNVPARFSPSPVAPLPERTEFDEWLAAELDQLRFTRPPGTDRQCTPDHLSCEWISRAMKVAIDTQKRVAEVINGACRREDYGYEEFNIDGYLEDVIELLDACNTLRETTESTRRYADSVRSVTRWCLAGAGDERRAAVERARPMLGSLQRAKRDCDESARFRKIGERIGRGGGGELGEALHASVSTAVFATRSLAAGLSCKSDRRDMGSRRTGFSSSWVTALDELRKEVKAEVEEKGRTRSGGVPPLNELSHVATAVGKLRKLFLRRPEKDDGRRKLISSAVETQGRRCDVLEGGIKRLESRVDELYRSLISVRVALLGIISGS